jgi:hypothetical protein
MGFCSPAFKAFLVSISQIFHNFTHLLEGENAEAEATRAATKRTVFIIV